MFEDEDMSWKTLSVPVKFTTNQIDGADCKPYFSPEYLDLCHNCYTKLLKEWPLTAIGAQGNNKYKYKYKYKRYEK